MNKKLIAMGISALILMTGCSLENEKTVEVSDNLKEIQVEAEAKNELEVNDGEIKKDVLLSSIEMLGLDDEKSKEYFDGGQENHTSDGKFFIGRIYNIEIFGIKTQLSTVYDNDEIINSVIINLGEEERDNVLSKMIDQLGKPDEINDTPSESGSTYHMWNVDGKLVYLYKGYGTLDIQLILPDDLKK